MIPGFCLGFFALGNRTFTETVGVGGSRGGSRRRGLGLGGEGGRGGPGAVLGSLARGLGKSKTWAGRSACWLLGDQDPTSSL